MAAAMAAGTKRTVTVMAVMVAATAAAEEETDA
jgi:hypothetical protein